MDIFCKRQLACCNQSRTHCWGSSIWPIHFGKFLTNECRLCPTIYMFDMLTKSPTRLKTVWRDLGMEESTMHKSSFNFIKPLKFVLQFESNIVRLSDCHLCWQNYLHLNQLHKAIKQDLKSLLEKLGSNLNLSYFHRCCLVPTISPIPIAGISWSCQKIDNMSLHETT